jgi:hypothetical protein
MFRRHNVLALRWILPIAQLVLSIALLWPVRHELTQQVKDASRYSRLTKTRAPTVSEVIAISIPERFTPQERAELASFERRKWMPAVLNLPSGLIQLPYIALNASKEEWVPVGLDLMTWRAITWPLLGIIFWWRVGRGIEALLATRRGLIQPQISSVETAIGGALFLFCAIAAICLPLCGNRHRDPDFPMKLFSCGFGMWALLGGALVTAKLCQLRIRRRMSAA